ncbi:hypothetical protein [Defluviimonas salinarum]|uniref:Uncharacterized protein n=1 Tax=Defluviimonas salinarum TaxID=2992147 RepID=A0ABT3JAN0_9RHOB|nr:hypothetical protein [Defluviimonas salinarum]MCW3784753.1 hypothetical protein [Defluviimonas salinarum]
MLVAIRRAALMVAPGARVSIRPVGGGYRVRLGEGAEIEIGADGVRVLHAVDCEVAGRILASLSDALGWPASAAVLRKSEIVAEPVPEPSTAIRRDTRQRPDAPPETTQPRPVASPPVQVQPAPRVRQKRLVFIDDISRKSDVAESVEGRADISPQYVPVDELLRPQLPANVLRLLKDGSVADCWLVVTTPRGLPGDIRAAWEDLAKHPGLGDRFRTAASCRDPAPALQAIDADPAADDPPEDHPPASEADPEDPAPDW